LNKKEMVAPIRYQLDINFWFKNLTYVM
jgi:hypothetical protein